ncbi:MAG: hypothetical protein H7Y07_09815 [Pyrinomonadaceae bacterium]|nr:hypothetical protein [Sphingobacteriaceae bacterium]
MFVTKGLGVYDFHKRPDISIGSNTNDPTPRFWISKVLNTLTKTNYSVSAKDDLIDKGGLSIAGNYPAPVGADLTQNEIFIDLLDTDDKIIARMRYKGSMNSAGAPAKVFVNDIEVWSGVTADFQSQFWKRQQFEIVMENSVLKLKYGTIDSVISSVSEAGADKFKPAKLRVLMQSWSVIGLDKFVQIRNLKFI